MKSERQVFTQAAQISLKQIEWNNYLEYVIVGVPKCNKFKQIANAIYLPKFFFQSVI